MKINKLLFGIIILGALLRFIFPNIPASLNWDEVSHGYNALSILKTGADEWGVNFPTIFRAYGDYKLPVYIYLTSVSEFFLGLSNTAVRLPSILAGIGTIIFSYLLAAHLFNRNIGLFTALFVAIEPWSLFLSRIAVEANVAIFFIVSGVYGLLKGVKENKWLVAGVVLLGLSVWTYNSARIFVPILLFAFFVIYRKELLEIVKKQKKIFWICVLAFVVFFLPMFYQLARPSGQARYAWVAILDQGAINKINEGQTNSPYGRVLHNKVTYFVSQFAKNYVSHFDPRYLFVNGGSHHQFSVPEFGVLYPINSIFILIGLLYLLKLRDKKSTIILMWLILGPVASSLTREAPHALRSITMLPIPMILAAIGLTKSFDLFNSRMKFHIRPAKFIAVGAYVLLLILFFEKYIFYYFFVYPYKYSQAWQFGHHHIVEYARLRYSEFDQIIVTKKYGEPHEFFLFYGAKQNAPWGWQPNKYKNDTNLVRYQQTDWFWVDSFDKFYFVNDWEIPKDNSSWKTERDVPIPIDGKKTLLITSPNNFPENGWERQRRIYFLDGTPAFDILKSR